jgi:hypothetical protein
VVYHASNSTFQGVTIRPVLGHHVGSLYWDVRPINNPMCSANRPHEAGFILQYLLRAVQYVCRQNNLFPYSYSGINCESINNKPTGDGCGDINI